jgi:hypothetical protein
MQSEKRDRLASPGAVAGVTFVLSAAIVGGIVMIASSQSSGAAAAPVLGKSVKLVPVSGDVFVRLQRQRSRQFVRLREARRVGVGSLVGVRKGRVRVVAEVDTAGKTQQGVFSKGVFQIRQSSDPADKGLTAMLLRGGDFQRCATSAGRAARNIVIRRGRANVRRGGRWRTGTGRVRGTAKGTIWDIVDRCEDALVDVLSGKVDVEAIEVVGGRRVIRRLRSTARGRFRVRGRHDAATVRGG